MNEKMPGFFFTGFFIIIDMPNDMNGFVKSITLSRAEVMVSGAIAMSASYARNSARNYHNRYHYWSDVVREWAIASIVSYIHLLNNITYLSDEFADHSIPPTWRLRVQSTVFLVFNQSEFVVEADILGYRIGQIFAIALISVITGEHYSRFGRLFH